MQTKILLLIILCCVCFSLSGQKQERIKTYKSKESSVTIQPFDTKHPGTSGMGSSETPVNPPETTIPGSEKVPMPEGSVNGTMRRSTAMEDGNLKVTFSYEVNYEGHDFALGDYIVDKSIGLKNMLLFMQKNVEGDFADYLKPPGRVSITITGGADATPIKGPILYNKEFGQVINENCLFEGKMQNIKIIEKQLITDNYLLAFLRSVAAKDYIIHNIFNKKDLQPAYALSATVSPDEGGKYRRVLIEMTIYDVLK